MRKLRTSNPEEESEDPDNNIDNLPALSNPNAYPEPLPVSVIPANTPLKAVQVDDAQMLYYQFTELGKLWHELPRSLSNTLTMINATTNLMYRRRDFLGLPRAYKDPKHRTGLVFPID